MPQYRKKPVVIEAMIFPGHAWPATGNAVTSMFEFDDWIVKHQGVTKCRYRGSKLIIPTLEGEMEASPGDWIIKGVAGELYPCKAEIFEATYEAV